MKSIRDILRNKGHPILQVALGVHRNEKCDLIGDDLADKHECNGYNKTQVSEKELLHLNRSQRMEIAEVFIHPKYEKTGDWDLAVIRLQE